MYVYIYIYIHIHVCPQRVKVRQRGAAQLDPTPGNHI